MKKKVLITGSAGLVGSATVDIFEKSGYEVIGIDNNGRHQFFGTEAKDIIGIPMNICDEQRINQLFISNKFDVIVHAAAQPSHDYSKDHVLEDFLVNAWGTLVLLEATRKHAPDAVFIFVSTDKVYGENMTGERLSDEHLGLDNAGKRSPFGCSKTAADIYVQEYGNYFGMKTACFRCGCITGRNHEGAELHGFLAHLAKTIREGGTYKIFGDGSNVRDQIHAEDLARAFLMFAENPRIAAVYNLGGGLDRAISVLQAGDLIAEKTGKEFMYEFHEARDGDRLYDVHDVSKFKMDYPTWNYQYSLQDIIDDVCAKEL